MPECPIPGGQECPTCMRRVPHPKKATSPQTKVKSQRVPIKDVEAYDVIEIETAKHLGVYGKPHWQFWTHNYALAFTLNSPEIRDALKSDDGP